MRFRLIIDITNNRTFLNGRIKKIYSDEIHVVYLDGWVDHNGIEKLISDSQPLPGTYNLIIINKPLKKVFFKNDFLGHRPLYFKLEESELIVSDNFWSVFQKTKSSIIDDETFDQLTYFTRIAPSYKTFVKDLFSLPAGSIASIDLISNSIDIKNTFAMIQKENNDLSLDDVVDELHLGIAKVFEKIAEQTNTIWYGNSGGLDSRIIPAYAKKYGIKSKGYLICNKYKNFNSLIRFKSQSYHSALNIAKFYGDDLIVSNYDQGNLYDSILRDIYVNPTGQANYHKNVNFRDYLDRFIVNGGSSFTMTNDTSEWKNNSFINNPIESVVNSSLSRHSKDGSNEIRNHLPAYLEKVSEEIGGIVPDNDYFSTIRTIYQKIKNQRSAMGAFESMSFAGDFQYIYHPFVSAKSLNWPISYFYNRKIQNVFFKKYHPGISRIPDQGSNRFENGFLSPLLRKFDRRFRGTGLDYEIWVNSIFSIKNLNLLDDKFKHKEIVINFDGLINRHGNYNRSQHFLDLLKMEILQKILKQSRTDIFDHIHEETV